MKGLTISLLIAAAAPVATAQQAVPEIRFDGNTELLKLPAGMYLGEVAGVAVNSQRHIFVFTRTGERSTVHGATSGRPTKGRICSSSSRQMAAS